MDYASLMIEFDVQYMGQYFLYFIEYIYTLGLIYDDWLLLASYWCNNFTILNQIGLMGKWSNQHNA